MQKFCFFFLHNYTVVETYYNEVWLKKKHHLDLPSVFEFLIGDQKFKYLCLSCQWYSCKLKPKKDTLASIQITALQAIVRYFTGETQRPLLTSGGYRQEAATLREAHSGSSVTESEALGCLDPWSGSRSWEAALFRLNCNQKPGQTNVHCPAYVCTEDSNSWFWVDNQPSLHSGDRNCGSEYSWLRW